MRDYRQLKVWEKAHKLVLDVYGVSKQLPQEEMFGLKSQLRRTAVSIPSNIAEGYGRAGDAELARFLHIAQGSSSELSYQLLLANDLGYIRDELYQQLMDDLDEIQRMMRAFVDTLRDP